MWYMCGRNENTIRVRVIDIDVACVGVARDSDGPLTVILRMILH